jgi:hypothetical protein
MEPEPGFPQRVFDTALERHPVFEEFQESLAEVIAYTIDETSAEAKVALTNNLVQHLGEFWSLELRRNSDPAFQAAVKAVIQSTLNCIAQIAIVAEMDPSSELEDAISEPKGTA